MNINYISIIDEDRSKIITDTIYLEREKSSIFNAPSHFFASEREITDSLWFFQLKPRVVNAAPVYISSIKGVYVLPCGVVVTEDGSVVVESIYPQTPESAPRAEDLFKSERDLELFKRLRERNLDVSDIINLPRAVHGRDIGERGYFHWIATVLPRISLVDDFFAGETGPYLLNPHPGFGVEWLNELGFYGKYRHPDHNLIYVEDLIFPCPAQVGNSHYTRNPTLLLNFKEKLSRSGILRSKNNSGSGRRIYISRSDAPVRRLVNEKDLVEAISHLKFEMCSLTGMSVRDQVDIFSSASVIIGPHGAGLVNVLFCDDRTTVIELMSTTRTWPGFKVISKVVGLKYCGFVSDIYDSDESKVNGYGNEDFSVDVSTCARFIESCIPPEMTP